MGAGASAALDDGALLKLVDQFNYLDSDHDGKVTLEELQKNHKEFDEVYDEAKVAAEFGKLHGDGAGSISLRAYLAAQGVDLVKFNDAKLEALRRAEVAKEAGALEHGVQAVEIIEGGGDAAVADAVVADAVDATPAAEAVVAAPTDDGAGEAPAQVGDAPSNGAGFPAEVVEDAAPAADDAVPAADAAPAPAAAEAPTDADAPVPAAEDAPDASAAPADDAPAPP
jgi:hypothetical protein